MENYSPVPGSSGPGVSAQASDASASSKNGGIQRAAAEVLLAAGARPAGHGSKLGRLLDS